VVSLLRVGQLLIHGCRQLVGVADVRLKTERYLVESRQIFLPDKKTQTNNSLAVTDIEF